MKPMIHKIVLTSGLLACVCTANAMSDPFKMSANVSLTSDYVWRGMTQTDNEPAIQGGFDLTHESGFYAGIWGSNVKFLEPAEINAGERASIETDLYAGYTGTADSGVTYSGGLQYYAYPGAGSDLHYNFYEAVVKAGSTLESGATWNLQYAFSPEFFGETGRAHYLGLDLGYTLQEGSAKGVGLTFHVGRQMLSSEGGSDYTDYGVSAAYNFADFKFTLNFTDTSLKDNEFADRQVFFSVSRTF